MPELPEVETVRRGLEPILAGRVIARVDQRRPDLRWPFPERFAERLTGRRVERLGRRSKYLLIGLEGGETWLVHLGMSGRMLVSGAQVGAFYRDHPAPQKHDHVVLHLEGGARVTFNDARRFGAMDLTPTDRAGDHPLLTGLGPEPFGNDFNEAYLADRLKNRKTPIKAALLDQRIVAGLGNIYVAETLYRARISPLRLAGDLAQSQVHDLVPTIRDVLAEAIEAGGSSLRDFRRANGELGYFTKHFQVYDREGEPCETPGCAGTVVRTVQSGRSSFWCPSCQR